MDTKMTVLTGFSTVLVFIIVTSIACNTSQLQFCSVRYMQKGKRLGQCKLFCCHSLPILLLILLLIWILLLVLHSTDSTSILLLFCTLPVSG